MIQLALTIFFVWLFFRLFDKEKLVDASNAVVFVVAPASLILPFNIVLAAVDSPEWVFYITQTGYFIVPLYFLKVPLEYGTLKSIGFALAVFIISIASRELVPILVTSQSM